MEALRIETLGLAGFRQRRGSIPVIALHGWLDNAASFLPLAARFEGFDLVALDLPGHAEKTGREAVELLKADECPARSTTLIIGGTQLALQVHESCGHPIELDRVFGTEASYAGTSFLSVDKLGGFRYGSDIVNIVQDSTAPGGLGSFGYDDGGFYGKNDGLYYPARDTTKSENTSVIYAGGKHLETLTASSGGSERIIARV